MSRSQERLRKLGRAYLFLFIGGVVYIPLTAYFFLIGQHDAAYVSISTTIAFWLASATVRFEHKSIELAFQRISEIGESINSSVDATKKEIGETRVAMMSNANNLADSLEVKTRAIRSDFDSLMRIIGSTTDTVNEIHEGIKKLKETQFASNSRTERIENDVESYSKVLGDIQTRLERIARTRNIEANEG